MPGNVYKPTSKDIFTGKGNALVEQDKNAPVRTSAAIPQPPQSQLPHNVRDQAGVGVGPKRHGSNKRRTIQVYGYVRKEVAAEIERLRDQGGRRLSRSAVVAALLEKAIRGHIDMQYGALLVPVIEQAINARLKARDARFAALLVRIAHDAGQTRSLVTNLLARAPGVTAELLETILDRSADRSKANLTHLSPQITELMQAVEQWMEESAKEESVAT